MKLLSIIDQKIHNGIQKLPAPLSYIFEGALEKPRDIALNKLDTLGNPTLWQAPPAVPLTGKYQKNQHLRELTSFVQFNDTHGPESIAIADDGRFFTGLHDGRIVQFDAQGNKSTICNTGGRPLGMRMHPDGDLLVCDTQLGLLKVGVAGTKKGTFTVLTNSAEGLNFGFADDLDVTQDGKHIYFTDASSKWGYEKDIFDHLEHGGHGRFLKYDMETGETTVLMHDLCFCNGVTLSPNEDYVLVVETGSYCVHRYWLKDNENTAKKAGTHELFIENLPGFPDNIRGNGKDRYWLAIPVLRTQFLDKLAPYPLVRFLAMQYLRIGHFPIKKTAMVLSFDLEGNLVDNFQHHGKTSYFFLTQAIEHKGELYCSSLHQNDLVKLTL